MYGLVWPHYLSTSLCMAWCGLTTCLQVCVYGLVWPHYLSILCVWPGVASLPVYSLYGLVWPHYLSTSVCVWPGVASLPVYTLCMAWCGLTTYLQSVYGLVWPHYLSTVCVYGQVLPGVHTPVRTPLCTLTSRGDMVQPVSTARVCGPVCVNLSNDVEIFVSLTLVDSPVP